MFNSLTSNTEASTNNKMWRAGLLVILLSGGILGQRLDCQMADVLLKCKNTWNGGYTYFNHNSESERAVFDTSNQEDCKPCCKDPNTSSNKCLETDLPDEDGESNDQLRELDDSYSCSNYAHRYKIIVNRRSVPVQCRIHNFVQVYIGPVESYMVHQQNSHQERDLGLCDVL